MQVNSKFLKLWLWFLEHCSVLEANCEVCCYGNGEIYIYIYMCIYIDIYRYIYIVCVCLLLRNWSDGVSSLSFAYQKAIKGILKYT